MWIITPDKVFNTDRFEIIVKVGNTTFGQTNGKTRAIAFDKSAYNKIVEAIKNNKPYVEVD